MYPILMRLADRCVGPEKGTVIVCVGCGRLCVVVGQRQRTLAMGMSMGGEMGMSFTIDGRTFDHQRDDQTVLLGTTEEWTITNTSPMDHPFHLHAWPFHVLATSYANQLTGVRQDVVIVPRQGWARLRIPFADDTGRSVYHCHVLDHEDLGMMATVNVGP
jgi:FtsP/CotA-like multicopper oxidase with cupredoxin domain